MKNNEKSICIIIGASHAGVNCAFSLRKEGWKGEIILIDKDPHHPYHRPPLSKSYFLSGTQEELQSLRPDKNYNDRNIQIKLNVSVVGINPNKKQITLSDGTFQAYEKLVLATGARAAIPSFAKIENSKNIFTLRNATDVFLIQEALQSKTGKKVVMIGGGYIGLETAASLRKANASVTILEREERILKRVTTPAIADYFKNIHTENGVTIDCGKNVTSIKENANQYIIHCDDESHYDAAIIIISVGIKINSEIAEQAGVILQDGIKADSSAKTNIDDIYAIGDCASLYNERYKQYLRIESVQNAVDQAKTAAATICGKEKAYDALPWFWSDQYETKLQMVGLSAGYSHTILRSELEKENSFSIWYFKQDHLIAVDAVNHPKAYVLGSQFIKSGVMINKSKLDDSKETLSPGNLIIPA